jgi:hypothetical protein
VAFEPIAAKRAKAAAISTGVAAAVYLATVLWVGRADVSAALKLVGADTLIALLALTAINYGVRFLRWYYYLHMLGNFISIRHDLRIYIGGFALTTTPGKAGEMARSLWLQPYGVPAASSLASFFAEQIQDFLVILILSTLGASLYPGGKWLLLGSFALALMALLVLSVPAITQSVLRSIAVSATLLIRLATLWFAVLLGIVALSIRAKIPLPAAAAPASMPAGAG